MFSLHQIIHQKFMARSPLELAVLPSLLEVGFAGLNLTMRHVTCTLHFSSVALAKNCLDTLNPLYTTRRLSMTNVGLLQPRQQ